ncbi:hypothetical protein COO91_06856 [Nostoc flagelliforme CCNUN1]|uniref:Uncharacterized protein n=1 Tax=Nostoc flagelliforme CCNUN1 TaxID=2038116 RepID=A0A2K8SZG0_9NOSO|nr:hypothetical protein COO91_06856 [Nostoc flagelliforme CCNUN1]
MSLITPSPIHSALPAPIISYVQAFKICEQQLGINHRHTVFVREKLRICKAALDSKREGEE